MAEQIKLSLVLNTDLKGGNVSIKGRTEDGPVEILIPGDAVAILTAVFASYAAKIQSGATKKNVHPTFVVHGHELLEPKDGRAGFLLKCLPDLNLWFSVPKEIFQELGQGFLKIDILAKKQQPRTRPN